MLIEDNVGLLMCQIPVRENNVKNIYQGRVHEVPDYTTEITIKADSHMRFVREPHLVGGVKSVFVFLLATIVSFNCHWEYSSQERPTKILTTLL